jgi:hypothetical protein
VASPLCILPQNEGNIYHPLKLVVSLTTPVSSFSLSLALYKISRWTNLTQTCYRNSTRGNSLCCRRVPDTNMLLHFARQYELLRHIPPHMQRWIHFYSLSYGW